MNATYFAALMSLPVENPDRPSLRAVVPYGDVKLASMARKFTTLSPEFHVARKPEWWLETNKEPIYPAWTGGKDTHAKWWRDWCNGPCRCGCGGHGHAAKS